MRSHSERANILLGNLTCQLHESETGPPRQVVRLVFVIEGTAGSEIEIWEKGCKSSIEGRGVVGVMRGLACGGKG
jgi:hypothetical protein